MSDDNKHALLHIKGLRKRYGDHEVLKGISLDLSAGETVALIGPSGSGKSSCLRCINYLEKPDEGQIWLNNELIGQVNEGGRTRLLSDREMTHQRKDIAMVFQQFYLWPHLNVRDNVALGPVKVQGMSRPQAYELAERMLDKVHLHHKADAWPEQLSGGQQQRVAIARALAQQPKIILFDEPTSALDPELVGEVLSVIRELALEGRSMILVTHEIRFARDVADRIIFMDEGQIIEQGPAKMIIDSPALERTKTFLNRVSTGA